VLCLAAAACRAADRFARSSTPAPPTPTARRAGAARRASAQTRQRRRLPPTAAMLRRLRARVRPPARTFARRPAVPRGPTRPALRPALRRLACTCAAAPAPPALRSRRCRRSRSPAALGRRGLGGLRLGQADGCSRRGAASAETPRTRAGARCPGACVCDGTSCPAGCCVAGSASRARRQLRVGAPPASACDSAGPTLLEHGRLPVRNRPWCGAGQRCTRRCACRLAAYYSPRAAQQSVGSSSSMHGCVERAHRWSARGASRAAASPPRAQQSSAAPLRGDSARPGARSVCNRAAHLGSARASTASSRSALRPPSCSDNAASRSSLCPRPSARRARAGAPCRLSAPGAYSAWQARARAAVGLAESQLSRRPPTPQLRAARLAEPATQHPPGRGPSQAAPPAQRARRAAGAFRTGKRPRSSSRRLWRVAAAQAARPERSG